MAFIEAFSPNIEEILEKMQRGRYKFFFNKTLSELAYEFRKKNKKYKHCTVKDVLVDLRRKGYVEVISGVIYIYGY